jgi:hypothetical protein
MSFWTAELKRAPSVRSIQKGYPGSSASPETTIDNDLDLVFNRRDDLIHDLQGMGQVVQGVAAMTRNNDHIGSRFNALFGIFAAQHPLAGQ